MTRSARRGRFSFGGGGRGRPAGPDFALILGHRDGWLVARRHGGDAHEAPPRPAPRCRYDPENPEGEPDNHGGRYSVLRLGALGRGEVTGDAHLHAHEHDSSRPLYLQSAGGGCALVRYRTAAGEESAPQLAPRDAPPVAMTRAGADGPFAYYEAELALTDAPCDYTFVVQIDGSPRSHPRAFLLDADRLPEFTTPEWAKHAIWYQILPDRFRSAWVSELLKGLGKAGDRELRAPLVQCAQQILGPFGRDSDLRRWGLHLASRGGATAKERAVIAVARKLAVLLHRPWVTGEVYEPLRNATRRSAAAKPQPAVAPA